MIPTSSSMWIQESHCLPPPIGPPAKALTGRAMGGRAPPSSDRTMPVRITTTRTPNSWARAASRSHASAVPARKSSPGGSVSSTSSSVVP